MHYRVSDENILDISEDHSDGFRVQQWKHTGIKHLRCINIAAACFDSQQLTSTISWRSLT
jgi:hypothetical protein